MARVLAIALLLAVTPACLRIQYDRCEESPPHPDCLDAGPDAAGATDAGVDGGAGDGGSDGDAGTDAGAGDAGTDAAAPADGGPLDDAGAVDAG